MVTDTISVPSVKDFKFAKKKITEREKKENPCLFIN